MTDSAPPFRRRPAGFLVLAAAFFAVMALAVFATGFLDSWGMPLMAGLVALGLIALLLLIGATAFTVLGFRAACRRKTAPILLRLALALAPPLLFAGLALAARPLLDAGDRFGVAARLAQDEARFATIIARVKEEQPAASDGTQRTEDGISFLVDRGPPLRVAFHPRGILDSWTGIVFDPTRALSNYVSQGPRRPGARSAITPDDLSGLFGGDLVGCRHLRDDFFLCRFT